MTSSNDSLIDRLTKAAKPLLVIPGNPKILELRDIVAIIRDHETQPREIRVNGDDSTLEWRKQAWYAPYYNKAANRWLVCQVGDERNPVQICDRFEDAENATMSLNNRFHPTKPVSGEPVAYVRDLDGTGSLHICAKGDPGAMGVAYVD